MLYESSRGVSMKFLLNKPFCDRSEKLSIFLGVNRIWRSSLFISDWGTGGDWWLLSASSSFRAEFVMYSFLVKILLFVEITIRNYVHEVACNDYRLVVKQFHLIYFDNRLSHPIFQFQCTMLRKKRQLWKLLTIILWTCWLAQLT